MAPATVIFKKARYDAALTSIVAEMLDALLGNSLQPGMRVLIKPNLLMASRPERAICAHPLVVRAAADYVLQKGGHCRIGDSPGIGSFEKILKDGEYHQALSDLDVTIAPFTVSTKIDIGPPFGRIDLCADVADADLIINIAKLKSHVQMRLTLGVKNLFGCVVGLKKTEWHMRVGVDRNLFARLLVQICQTVHPAVTLVDGILALEGQGPGKSGTPRPIGVLIGGNNPFAVDAAICRMLGTTPDTVPTHQAAKALELVPDIILTLGDAPMVTGFQFPVIAPLEFGPKLFRKFMRRHWVQRPVVNSAACSLCGKCHRHCPAGAIQIHRQQLQFDYDRCIRCYCCVEICKEGALSTRETPAGKLLRHLTAAGARLRARMHHMHSGGSRRCDNDPTAGQSR
ncbi:MAG: DUF362 domain-containing protein [Desulfobacterales bacterium]|jgi:uncharacterized protein (DUF362 family)/ferredoxin|nr:DUF362 domain-containing protein [Desulfobacterales bacterium]